MGKPVVFRNRKLVFILITFAITFVAILIIYFVFNVSQTKHTDSSIEAAGSAISEEERAGSRSQYLDSTEYQLSSDEEYPDLAENQLPAHEEDSGSMEEQLIAQQGTLSATAGGQAATQQGTLSPTAGGQAATQQGNPSPTAGGQTAAQQGNPSAAAGGQAAAQQGNPSATAGGQTVTQSENPSSIPGQPSAQAESPVSITGQPQLESPVTENLAGLDGSIVMMGSQGNENEPGHVNNELQQAANIQGGLAEIIPPPPPPPPRVIPGNMALITRGSYIMGSPSEETDRSDDETQHWVTISSFYISRTEVTQREYEEIMGVNPSYFRGPDLPVENVSWFDAVEYCNRLSRREGLTPAYTITGTGNYRVVIWDRSANGYRLPTEAEWEYACRAGTTTPFNTGNNITRSRANFFGRGTVEVGSLPPNSWGLYDMHGNVAEWCWDLYSEYGSVADIDRAGVFSQVRRVFRGGSWLTTTMRLRSAFRDHAYPSHQNMSIGFRVAFNDESRVD